MGNLAYMAFVYMKYIHALGIKNKMVRLFYFLAFFMTVSYMIFQINGIITGGVKGRDAVLGNQFDVRNLSLSIAKLFDFMLSLQIDYTMLKLALSIKVNLGEIHYCRKVQRKKNFAVFAVIMTLLMITEIFFVYLKLNAQKACLLNAITFSILALINVVIMFYLFL